MALLMILWWRLRDNRWVFSFFLLFGLLMLPITLCVPGFHLKCCCYIVYIQTEIFKSINKLHLLHTARLNNISRIFISTTLLFFSSSAYSKINLFLPIFDSLTRLIDAWFCITLEICSRAKRSDSGSMEKRSCDLMNPDISCSRGKRVSGWEV